MGNYVGKYMVNYDDSGMEYDGMGVFHRVFRFWPRILEIISIMNHHMGFNN